MAPQTETERRFASDRRRFARGGRRPTDKAGLAPLVLVADDDPCNSAHCEEILVGLRFAVAPAHSVDEALRVMRLLRPNLMVAHLSETARLEEELRSDPYGADLPLITLDDGHPEAGALIEEIRRVLRARNTLSFPAPVEPGAVQYQSGSR
jgi:CheY-like chemotaxis protein